MFFIVSGGSWGAGISLCPLVLGFAHLCRAEATGDM